MLQTVINLLIIIRNIFLYVAFKIVSFARLITLIRILQLIILIFIISHNDRKSTKIHTIIKINIIIKTPDKSEDKPDSLRPKYKRAAYIAYEAP